MQPARGFEGIQRGTVILLIVQLLVNNIVYIHRHLTPHTDTYDVHEPSTFFEFNHSGACTAILPTHQRTLGEYLMQHRDCDNRGDVSFTMHEESAVAHLPVQPEFQKNYSNHITSVYGGSAYCNEPQVSSVHLANLMIGQVATERNNSKRSTSAPPRSTNYRRNTIELNNNSQNVSAIIGGSNTFNSTSSSGKSGPMRWASNSLSDYIQNKENNNNNVENGNNARRHYNSNPTAIIANTHSPVVEVAKSNTHFSIRRSNIQHPTMKINNQTGNTVAHLLTHSNIYG